MHRECLEFSSIFVRVAKRTQTPSEVLARHQVASLQQELRIMREKPYSATAKLNDGGWNGLACPW
jgi:hypothetical protein